MICSVVKAELYYGSRKSRYPEKNLAKQQQFVNKFISLPFDDRAAEVYGLIRSQLENSGTPIGPNDMLIASIALAFDQTLITNNTREFSRIKDLRIEDWETELKQ
jgi:tRNA(fMet)-specific endonuclease VapC